ncbi:MAG: hypothetical protein KatS3mg026_1620 [Bacteroidia bacterium]|nr:MAG: hypothetical protein KatS3mg026_1620 [Bacteroidia bacterium]
MEENIAERLDQAIRSYLDKHQLKYKVDDDGDFHLVVGFSDLPVRVRLLLLKEGAKGEILSLVARYEGPYVFSEEEALRKANQWNRERRWPRIYWRESYFYGDFHLDCEVGIPDQLVELTIHRFLMGALQFLLTLSGHEEDHDMLANLLKQALKRSSLPN